jgi:hypothetical protein
VVGEHVGISQQFERDSVSSRSSRIPEQVAAAYFKAHPERKPWEDAKPGEGWSVATAGGARLDLALVNTDGEFVIATGEMWPVGADFIIEARRIYPEDAS